MKIILLSLIIVALSKPIYDVKKSYVTPVSEINFEK